MAATMMPAFAKAGVHVKAVVSRDSERAVKFAQAFHIPVGETVLSSVLKRDDIDAVYIANAPQEHANTCIAALEAGKAVLCEKPMAMSEAEAQRIVNAAHQTQTLCMEGLWTLFLPAHRRFLELAGAGRCGKANSLVADFGYPLDEEVQPQLHTKDPVSVLLDRGIYLIALALSVFGPVERVDAQLDFGTSGEDENAFLQLRHASGSYSQLSASFTSLMSNTATLACSRGLIRLEAPLIGSEVISIRHATAVRPDRDRARPASLRDKIMKRLRESPQLRRINQSMKKPDVQHVSFGSNPYLPELSHFVTLFETGAKQSNIVPLNFSLDIARIIDRARAVGAGQALF